MFYFQAINCSYVTSRDQYQALRLATVVHVTTSSIIVENFIPNQTVTGAWARRSGRLKFNGHNSILNVDLTFCYFEFSCLVL